MTKPIDALQMAREAELLFNEHLGTEAARNFQKNRIEMLVAMVLERAAVECEDRMSHWKMMRDLERGCAAHDCALSILALKPVLEKDNT